MPPFEFEGRVYLRPLSRGICLGEDMEQDFGWALEDWLRQEGQHVSPSAGTDVGLRIRVELVAAPPGEAPAVAHNHCYCTLIQRKGAPKSYMVCCQCGDERDIPRHERRVYVEADADAAPPGEEA